MQITTLINPDLFHIPKTWHWDSDSEEESVPDMQSRLDRAVNEIKAQFPKLAPDITESKETTIIQYSCGAEEITAIHLYVVQTLKQFSIPKGISYKGGIGHLCPFPHKAWLPNPFTSTPYRGSCHPGYMPTDPETVYARWFRMQVTATAGQLQVAVKGTDPFLQPILTNLGLQRKKVAIELDQEDAEDFGVYRRYAIESLYITPMSPRYPTYNDRLQQAFKTPFPWEQLCTVSWKDISLEYLDAPILSHNSVQTTLDDRAFIVRHQLPKQSRPSLLSIVSTTGNQNGRICIIHASDLPSSESRHPHEVTREILESFEPPIRKLLLNTNFTKKELLNTLAQVHWHLAHLMLFKRGSASISEILVQAIAEAAGFPNSEWAEYIMPDIEAMLRYPQQFIEDYPHLLNLGKNANPSA